MYLKIKYFLENKTIVSSAIIFIFSLSFSLCFIYQSPLWYDELFSLFWSQLNTIEDVKKVSTWDVAPPGYNILMHLWTKVFGLSSFSARLLSCVANALSCSLLYVFVKKTFNLKTALIVVVLFFTNSTLFFYANEARCFSFLMLLSVISSFLFVELMNKPKIIYVITLGVVNYYLFYTHFSIIFLFAAQFLFAVCYFKHHLLNWYLWSCFIFVGLLLPFLPRVLELAGSNGQNHWVPKPTPKILEEYLSGYFNNLYFGLFLLFLLFVGILQLIKNRKSIKLKPEFLYFLLSGVGFIIMCYVESVYKAPLFLKRYLMVSIIGVFIVFSYLISLINLFKYSYLLVFVSIFLCGALTINLSTDKGMNIERQMAFVKQQKTATTAVFTDNDLGIYYYDVNIFKQTYDLKNTLNKNDIFQVYDTTSLINIDFSRYDKIVVANTWPNSNNSIKSWLMKKYPNIKEYLYPNDGCQTYIYTK
jgi:uncharacterized membrane protein